MHSMSHIAPSIGAGSETRSTEAWRRSRLIAASNSAMQPLSIGPDPLYTATAVHVNRSALMFPTQPQP